MQAGSFLLRIFCFQFWGMGDNLWRLAHSGTVAPGADPSTSQSVRVPEAP